MHMLDGVAGLMETQTDNTAGRAPTSAGTCVHAYSGFEKSVAQALRDRIVRTGMEDRFGDVLVPTEEVVEMRSGQKRRSERKFFPGYVLVQIATQDEGGIPRIDSESWHLIKETPKVMGFIGGTADKPLPIKDDEADAILQRVQDGVEKPRPKVCSSRARWSAWSTARSTTSTAWSRKSITTRAACAWRC